MADHKFVKLNARQTSNATQLHCEEDDPRDATYLVVQHDPHNGVSLSCNTCGEVFTLQELLDLPKET